MLTSLGATNRQAFESMLAKDKVTYGNLVKNRALIRKLDGYLVAFNKGDRSKFKTLAEAQAFKAKLDIQVTAFNQVLNSYKARQKDYRENKSYQLAQYLQEVNDSFTKALTDAWNKLTSGFGLAPLSLPVVLVAGAVISVTVISYFVSRYYQATSLDYDKALRTFEELYQTNPQDAMNFLEEIGVVQQNQDEGVLKTVATGLKYGIMASIAGATLYGGYKLAVKEKIIKPFKSKRK